MVIGPHQIAVDGRPAWRDRHREAVLDTALALFAEGDVAPSPDAVAERSGLSLRVVLRHYEDTEVLLRETIARSMERHQHLFELDRLGEGPLAERIDRFVEARLRLYVEMAGIARAARVRARTDPVVRDQLRRRLTELQLQTEAMFAPELRRRRGRDRGELAAALNVASGVEALDQLTGSLGLSASDAGLVVRRSLRALLTDAEVADPRRPGVSAASLGASAPPPAGSPASDRPAGHPQPSGQAHPPA